MAYWRVFSTATAWCILALVSLQSGLLLLRVAWPAGATNVWSLGAVQVCVLGTLATVFALRHRKELGVADGQAGFRQAFAIEPCSWSVIGLGVVAASALQVPAEVLRAAVEQLSPTPEYERLLQTELLRHDTPLRVVSLFLVIGLIGPFFEELLYRGCFFRFVAQGVGPRASWLFTSLVFACTHAAFRDWPSLLGVALMLGYFRWRSGSLWPGFALHAAFNSETLLRVVTDAGDAQAAGIAGAVGLVASLGVCGLSVVALRRQERPEARVWRA